MVELVEWNKWGWNFRSLKRGKHEKKKFVFYRPVDARVGICCEHSATIPVQLEGGAHGWWISMHNRHLKQIKETGSPDILFVGDSITHGWTKEKVAGGKGVGGLAIWKEYYADRNALNVGISGDRTEHVLWRLQNGVLENIQPNVAILTIGHNNGRNSADEIADGMLAILREIRRQCPETKIILIPHFPATKAYWRDSKTIQAYNRAVQDAKGDEFIIPLDINEAFLNKNGVLKDPALIPDDTHPAEPGYRIWAEEMEPTLARLLDGEK